MSYSKLYFYSIKEALDKTARSLFPFSSLSTSDLLHVKTRVGSMFGINEEIPIIINISTENIKRILYDFPLIDKKTSATMIIPIEYSRLTRDCLFVEQTEEDKYYKHRYDWARFVESKAVDISLTLSDPKNMLFLQNLLKCSIIKNSLYSGICNDLIKVFAIDDGVEHVDYNEEEDSYENYSWTWKQTRCFTDSSQSSLEMLDNWRHVLLDNHYLSHDKSTILNMNEANIEGPLVYCSQERIGIHPIDLQTFINNLLTSRNEYKELYDKLNCIFSSSTENVSSVEGNQIAEFLSNIKQTPKLEKMPLEDALIQLYQHYSDSLLEMTPLEILYGQAKIEFPPHKINLLTKPVLINKVKKFVEYKGFTVLEQSAARKAAEGNHSLKGKILLKNDVAAIATLLFNQRRKLGGATPSQAKILH